MFAPHRDIRRLVALGVSTTIFSALAPGIALAQSDDDNESPLAPRAATGPFIMPDSGQPEFTKVWHIGDVIAIEWNPCNSSLSDLWLTTYNYADVPWALRLAPCINVSIHGVYLWTIKDIPAEIYNRVTQFTLRLKAVHGDNIYRPKDPEIPSPGIVLLQRSSSSSSGEDIGGGAITGATTSPSGATTKAPMSASTVTSNTSITPTTRASASDSDPSGAGPATSTMVITDGANPPPASALSAGAASGITIGAVLAVLGIGAILWFTMFRRRRGPPRPGGGGVSPYELPGSSTNKMIDDSVSVVGFPFNPALVSPVEMVDPGSVEKNLLFDRGDGVLRAELDGIGRKAELEGSTTWQPAVGFGQELVGGDRVGSPADWSLR